VWFLGATGDRFVKAGYREDKTMEERFKLAASIDGISGLEMHYPTEVTDELLQAMGEQDKVVPYLDLPLQHASRSILKAMRRPSKTEHLEGLIARLRAAVPDISIRTAFIMGFPGETEEDSEQLLDFCRAMEFDHVGLFVYSAEEGSPAADLPDQVPPDVQRERYERLAETVEAISERKIARRVGSDTEVLIDGDSDVFPDFWRGRHPGQAPDVDGVVYVPRAAASPGQIIPCRLTASQGYDLFTESI